MQNLQYYDENGVRTLKIAQQGVCRFKIDMGADDESKKTCKHLKNGEFQRKIQDVCPVRVQYKTDTQKHVLYLTVEAKPRDPGFDRLPPDPNAANILFRWDNSTASQSEPTHDCILSIDLGNTRTVALLIDKVDTMAEMTCNGVDILTVPMIWDRQREKCINEPFESIASLIDTSYDGSNDQNSSYTECRKSFVKLGSFALYNRRAIPQNCHGRHTLSSPKRYYWDNTPCRSAWIAVRYLDGKNQASSIQERFDNLQLAQLLAKDFKCETSMLPNAAVLSAMVVEIYEQTLYYISSQSFKNRVQDDCKRQITEIHVTYPSTLTSIEKKQYNAVLQKGISAFSSLKGIDKINVKTDIDEATSVLALYTFSKIKQYRSARFWLQTIGRKNQFGPEATIAVIDIGGGTTDLSISRVTDNKGKAQIQLQFRDGINSAGDDFILNFLESIVKRKVYEAFQKHDCDCGDFEKFIENYNNNLPLVEKLKRDFWFPITIAIAQKCDEILIRKKKNEAYSSEFKYELGTEAAPSWTAFWTKIKNAVYECDKITLGIKVDEDIIEAYQKSVRNSFCSIASVFGKFVCQYNTDIVLFSGKTSEFYYIQEYFKKFIAIPDTNIETMKKFEVGSWCRGITENKIIKDSKVSTALGGALYTLRTKSFTSMNFEIASNVEYLWGPWTPDHPYFLDEEAYFAQGDLTEETLVLNGDLPLYIARRPNFSETTTLSYCLRIKPDILSKYKGGVNEGTKVTIECSPCGHEVKLEIKKVHGTFQKDGQQIKESDLELQICNMSTLYGLDDGKI